MGIRGAPKKAEWREERRKRAWALKQQGWLQKDIAVALGVRTSAVSHWCTRARKQGGEALAHRPPPGLAPRLWSGAKSAAACAAGPRGASLWVQRRCVDRQAGGAGE